MLSFLSLPLSLPRLILPYYNPFFLFPSAFFQRRTRILRLQPEIKRTKFNNSLIENIEREEDEEEEEEDENEKEGMKSG